MRFSKVCKSAKTINRKNACKNSLMVVNSVVDLRRFDSNPNPNPDPTFHFDAYPDPDPNPKSARSFTHVGKS